MLFSVCEETQGWIHQLYLLRFILFSVYVNLRLAYVSRYMVLNTKMSRLSREEQSAQRWLLQIFMSLWLRSGLQRPGCGSSFHAAINSLSFVAQAAEPRPSSHGHKYLGHLSCTNNFPCNSQSDQNSPYLSWKFKYLLDWPKHKDHFQSTFLHHFCLLQLFVFVSWEEQDSDQQSTI